MRVLTVNCGSSSLKFDLVDVSGLNATRRIARGAIERIGSQADAWLEANGGRTEQHVPATSCEAALQAALAILDDAGLRQGIEAVGHRVVHGGPRFHDAVLIDDEVLRAVEQVSELAPLHNRPALEAISAARNVFGTAMPMVAAFDTSFYAGLPDVAREYALPHEVRERLGIRRYGFHGLAHRYMIERYRALRPGARTPRLITLQLGSGCSVTASRAGLPLDTSMGFTPLEGLIMGTRSGDIDPMLPLLMISRTGMSAGEVEDMLNTKSGLLGLSGLSEDLRELQHAAARGHAEAALAVEAFYYRARKYIGAYLAALGGADAIVFGGGIGERSPEARERICGPFGWCGFELDRRRNRAVSGDDSFISTPEARMEALVVHVDEGSLIARDVFACLRG